MKISIYTRDSGFLWVETKELTNPDGCTRIDDDYNAVIRADALKDLLLQVIALPKEKQEKLVVEVEHFDHNWNKVG